MALNDLLNDLKNFNNDPDMNNTTPSWATLLLKGMEVLCVQLQESNKEQEKQYRELRKENEQLRTTIDDEKMYSQRNYMLLHGIDDGAAKPKPKVVLKRQLGDGKEIVLDITNAVSISKD